MIQAVIDLEKILLQEKSIYEKIYMIEEEKKNIILNRDGKNLEIMSVQQEAFVKEIEVLEMERDKKIKNYIKDNRIEDLSQEVTLRDVIISMDEDSAHKLLQLGLSLKKIIKNLSFLQANNEKLISDNMEFYDLLLSGLKSGEPLDSGYGLDGRQNNRVQNSMLFNQTF